MAQATWVRRSVSSARLARGRAAGASAARREDTAEVAEEPAGGVGVSPVELIPRIELRETYLNLAGGVSSHDTTAEIDIQFLSRVLLRYQAPFRLMETPNGEISGRGDLEIDAIGIVGSDPRWVAAVLVGDGARHRDAAPAGRGQAAGRIRRRGGDEAWPLAAHLRRRPGAGLHRRAERAAGRQPAVRGASARSCSASSTTGSSSTSTRSSISRKAPGACSAPSRSGAC